MQSNSLSEAKLAIILMTRASSERERTEEEYRSLLRSSEVELMRVIPTSSVCSTIEAVKR